MALKVGNIKGNTSTVAGQMSSQTEGFRYNTISYLRVNGPTRENVVTTTQQFNIEEFVLRQSIII